MPQGVVATFDADADRSVRALWSRLDAAGLPPARPFPPHLTFALASDIPAKTRTALAAELRLLAVPDIWLSALSTFSANENALVLAAVTDAELLAVHSALHDVLAGKVRNPSAYYLPGNWMPHCTLVQGVPTSDMTTAFNAVFPTDTIRAKVVKVSILDTNNPGTEDVLFTR
ncbi:2'-5' RNA ligase family protein [Actinokineospora sp. PR83]|uniref:2'-5' RNA ligase family protein n=1 Tax=Actinokineospora sp. PR83 TaxID=2884908 RepID=UPI001F3A1B8F|nr:2'-5' RNA ligase family protein [Actinokineospora sp. PR83]MCG8917807.1 2'-5' RNA ligase family protein [Actinokineospora sp. PR83]